MKKFILERLLLICICSVISIVIMRRISVLWSDAPVFSIGFLALLSFTMTMAAECLWIVVRAEITNFKRYRKRRQIINEAFGYDVMGRRKSLLWWRR